VIVRLMGEGQYHTPEELRAELNRLDGEAAGAVEAGDETKVRELLERMSQAVRDGGERLEDADLSASDLIIPPADLSLEEARELFSGEGLIPDLPT
jgi:hypothetical protein